MTTSMDCGIATPSFSPEMPIGGINLMTRARDLDRTGIFQRSGSRKYLRLGARRQQSVDILKTCSVSEAVPKRVQSCRVGVSIEMEAI